MTRAHPKAWVGVLLLLFSTLGAAQQPPAFATVSQRAAPTSNQPGLIRQRYVEIAAPDVLKDPTRAAVLRLDLFPDVSFRALRKGQENSAYGVSWTGSLEGYPMSDAVFVLVDDVLRGHVYAPFGFFRIDGSPATGYLVQQVDISEVDGPSDDAIEAPAEPLRDGPVTGADSSGQIDVMVLYTRDALNGFGGSSQARAAIDLAVSETNQAYRNSNVNTSIRLVHSRELSFSETGDASDDLARFRSSSDAQTLRNQFAADLVMLITERMDACGIGYLPGRSGSPTGGYSMVKRSCMSNGRTFAHELGHNMGATHDWYVDAGGTSTYSYAYGYTSLAGRFLDIMSYYNMCNDTRTTCAQLLQFSNPRLSRSGFRTGVFAGTSQSCSTGVVPSVECDADVATTFNNMIAIIANYRESSTATGNNRAPTVSASCNPCTVSVSGTSTLRASASDPDGDAVTLRWSATQGTLSSATGTSTAWTAPSQTGTVTATVIASDGRGGSASANVTLQVVVSDRLQSGGQLLPDQFLRSANARFRLVFQADGNLVLYDDQNRAAVWATNTSGGARPTRVVMQSDGNMVLYDGQGAPRFATNTGANVGGASLLLQNDGNLVIYRGDGRVLWDRINGRQNVAPAGCTVQDISVGGSVGGSWASDCNATHRNGAYARYYRFTLTATRTIQVTLASNEDAYLYVLRGSDQNGAVVTEDDDSGDGTNSFVTVSLGAGTYVLEATTYEGGRTGSFTLSLNAPSDRGTAFRQSPAQTAGSKKPVR